MTLSGVVVLYKATDKVGGSLLPRVPGMTLRKNWSFRVTNPDLIPREYLMPDLVKIGGVVRALKNQCRIPGIEVYEEDTIQGRRPASPALPKLPFSTSESPQVKDPMAIENWYA